MIRSMSRNKKLVVGIISSLLEELEDDSAPSSSSSSSDDDVEEYLPCHKEIISEAHPNGLKFAEEIVPRLASQEFKSYFRIEPTTFEYIENLVSPSIINDSGTGRPRVDPRKQLLMTLWFLTTAECYRSISDRFGTSRSTLWEVCFKVCEAISFLSSDCISWPEEQDEMEKEARDFEKICGFPGVVGCVGTLRVRINTPRVQPEMYKDKEGYHSILLQAVANEKCMFTDCYVGEGGAVRDDGAFRRSFLGRELEGRIPNDLHILGNSAYPLKINLMTPFKNSVHLTVRESNYNDALMKTRIPVKRSFVLLKSRFKRLRGLNMNKTELIPTVIMACCVLHNMCLLREDEIVIDFQDEVEVPLDDADEDEEELDAREKRDAISTLFR